MPGAVNRGFDAGAVRRLLREAGWAPLAVIVLNVVVERTHHPELWGLVHLLGAAALAYFLLVACGIARERTGSPGRLAGTLLSFSLACTIGVLWEIGEFAIDGATGSTLQEGLSETMHDLVFDVVGAGIVLVLHALLR